MVDLRQNAEADSILEGDGEHLLPVYARYPVVIERGQGVYLFDSSGNRYVPQSRRAANIETMAGVSAS